MIKKKENLLTKKKQKENFPQNKKFSFARVLKKNSNWIKF